MPTLPKLKVYPLRKLAELRQKLSDQLLQTHYNVVMTPENLTDVAILVNDTLGEQVPFEVIYQSLSHLSQSRLTKELIQTESQRIAGSIRRLLAGQAAHPWRQQRVYEWVPLRVTEMRLYRTKKQGRLGVLSNFAVLAGTPCGENFEAFWSQQFCHFLSQEAGFTKRKGKHPFSKMEEYVGFLLYGLLRPAERGRLSVEKYQFTEAIRKQNRELLAKRLREGFVCPFKFRCACTACPAGTDRCPVALRPRTYVQQRCTRCEQVGWFDPQWVSLGLCVACQRKQDISRG